MSLYKSTEGILYSLSSYDDHIYSSYDDHIGFAGFYDGSDDDVQHLGFGIPQVHQVSFMFSLSQWRVRLDDRNLKFS
jgi:hypothetical protein